MSFGGSVPKPPTPPPPPKQADEALENAANAERLRRAMAYGKQKTILTEGAGTPTVRTNTLLGQ